MWENTNIILWRMQRSGTFDTVRCEMSRLWWNHHYLGLSGGRLKFQALVGNSQFVQIKKDMVFASLSNGMGADRCEKLCETLNLSAYTINHFNIMPVPCTIWMPMFSKSSEIMWEEHLKCPADDNVGDDGVMNISVSYDGSWLTRGHTSQIGLGCVVDLLTGLVIDAHVMSTYCQVCKNIAALKTEEERKKQEEIHAGSGKCFANF